MEPYETLKVARTIKERGNDCFKRGQLCKAQRDYTEVLAMLTEEITFTGEDQRKEKEALVLTAHLNLAQCALRLGDNARVIYHCNTALSMDSNNVKAHFRKARAFKNRSEFAEALEGYRHVLTLEPDNETVQRQLSECQKKLDSQKAKEQMSNKMAGQEDQEIEDEDVEVVYEDFERDPQTRFKNCTKNPGHDKFINVNDFKIEHLPPDYRDQELFDHVKYQSQITVMLQVWPARKFRSRCGPGTGRNKSGNPGSGRRVRPLKHGSGWLHLIDFRTESEQPCPCQTCKNSGSPVKIWAEIEIMTAGHVVCNNKEANNTECYFFYDTENVDLNSCPKLYSAVIKFRNEHFDTCTLHFVFHDVELLQQLYQIKESHNFSLCSIRLKYSSPALSKPKGSLLEQFEQLWQRWIELTTEHGHLVEQLVAIFNGNPQLEYQERRKVRKESLADDRLSQLLLDKIRGGTEYQKLIEELQDHQELYKYRRESTKQSVLLPNSERELAEGRKFWHWQFENSVVVMEKQVIRFKHWLDENVPLPPPVEFNEDHRLTIIVSHPHGCSKKITIGELTERTTAHGEQYSQLAYTTPTCPGSSGAQVFLLGQMAIASGHPHSAKRSGGSLGQLNESAFGVCV